MVPKVLKPQEHTKIPQAFSSTVCTHRAYHCAAPHFFIQNIEPATRWIQPSPVITALNVIPVPSPIIPTRDIELPRQQTLGTLAPALEELFYVAPLSRILEVGEETGDLSDANAISRVT